MKKNIGNTDKIIRSIIGLVIAVIGIYYKSWFGLIAIIPLATAMIGYCPLYSLFKKEDKSSSKTKQVKKK
ncbi:MAG: DUF2892 domain-containing protein [Candidatus Woesearchaeota archaeon]|jgi:hypothetical protein